MFTHCVDVACHTRWIEKSAERATRSQTLDPDPLCSCAVQHLWWGETVSAFKCCPLSLGMLFVEG